MARTDNLDHFLTDVADAIRAKTGGSSPISANNFDTEIANIPTSGGDPTDYFNGDYGSDPNATNNFFKKNYIRSTATLVDIDCTGKNSLYQFFQNCLWSKLPRLKNTGSITDLNYCFDNCNNITGLDLSLVTTGNCSAMDYTFRNCSLLTSLNVSTFDFSKVTSLVSTFANLYNLEAFNLGTSSTPVLTSLSGTFTNIFNSASEPRTLDISNFDLSNVTTINSCFNSTANNENLGGILFPSLASGRFFSNKLTNMSAAFNGRSKLTTLPINDFDTSNVTEFSDTFSGCSRLAFDNVVTLDVSSAYTISGTFINCRRLKNITFNNIKGDVTFRNTFSGAFIEGYSSREDDDVITFIGDNTGKTVSVIGNTFASICSNYGNRLILDFYGGLYLSLANTSTTTSSLAFYRCYSGAVKIKGAKIKQLNLVQYNSYITEWEFENCDFSECTRLYRTFYMGGNNLKRIKIPGLTGIESGLTMSDVFYSCTTLELLDIRDVLFSQGAPISLIEFGTSTNQIPSNCQIVVKDATEKAIVNTQAPRFINVLTVAEYEAL